MLDYDAALAAALPGRMRDTARGAALAAAFRLERGRWDPRRVPALGRPGTGALVLRGVLLHEMRVAKARAAELVGPGDLVHPVDTRRFSAFDEGGSWWALEPALLAVIDRRFLTQAAAVPALATAVAERSGSHLRALALQMLASRSRRVDDRLVVLFSLLAERWGRVSSEGIRIPVPLSHMALARLVAARRPSVTTAIGGLRRRGVVQQLAHEGWLLPGECDVSAFMRNLSSAERSPGDLPEPAEAGVGVS